MTKNLLVATSVLSRLALPLEIKSNKVKVIGTSVEIKAKGSSLVIGSEKMPPMDLEFSLDNFNIDLFIQRTHQALHNELDQLSSIIIAGIYNTLISSGVTVNQLYIENPKSNTSTVILPFGNSIAVSVFHGAIADGFVKTTMVLPLANDPLQYLSIIRSIS